MDNIHEYHLHLSGENIMLSTELQQKSMIKRIEKIVAILMEERPLFKEELNPTEMVELLCTLFETNLPIEQFNTMTDQDLRKRCSMIMVTEAVAGTLNELTPEQMAIFDEAIKRK
jgi:hypothetical protein